MQKKWSKAIIIFVESQNLRCMNMNYPAVKFNHELLYFECFRIVRKCENRGTAEKFLASYKLYKKGD